MLTNAGRAYVLEVRRLLGALEKDKNIAPATTAAAAITKDIPTGVVNLATPIAGISGQLGVEGCLEIS